MWKLGPVLGSILFGLGGYTLPFIVIGALDLATIPFLIGMLTSVKEIIKPTLIKSDVIKSDEFKQESIAKIESFNVAEINMLT